MVRMPKNGERSGSGPEANEVRTSVPSVGERTYQNQPHLLLGILIILGVFGWMVLFFGKLLVSLNRPLLDFFRLSSQLILWVYLIGPRV